MVAKSLWALLFVALGSVLTLVVMVAVHLRNRPDLKLWHKAYLDAEFTTHSTATDLNAYLEIEERLFRQLDRRVLDQIPAKDRGPANRYVHGSLTDPGRWARNWNRTFEYPSETPTAGVLMLHGMSDAPYSLRALGGRLRDKGAWVLGLRLPGHGTIPSGLVRLRWEDMAAAVRLAMRHLHDRVGDKPIVIVGYSMGGALAVDYALDRLAGHALPAAARIVLISPAVGVTRLAALSVWQARLGRWLGIDKLAWNSIQPEYNSFKYSSFAINAGVQVYRLTTRIQDRLRAARQSGSLKGFPPVLAFQSVVDDTVSTPAVITGLFRQLARSGDELVLFDINHRAGVDNLLADDPLAEIMALVGQGGAGYRFDLVTNGNSPDPHVAVVPYETGAPGTALPLAWTWPDGVYALSHIALPFPEDDPLYGPVGNAMNPGIVLSRIILRGERGVLNIPADEMLRLRWNPFYPYLDQRVIGFLGL